MVFGFKRKGTPKALIGTGVSLSKLKSITGLGQMDYGAPAPIILAGEHKLSVAYYLHSSTEWDGENIHLRDPTADVGKMAIFYISGLNSFTQKSTLHHLCPFFDYNSDDYPSHDVWEIEGPESKASLESQSAYLSDKRLIFSFHDTAIDCFCSEYKYETLVSSGVNILTKMEKFVFQND